MNTKIPLRQLAESIAASSGKSPEEAMLFVKHLFSEVSDRLYNGESVVIDGLGTFSAVADANEPVRFEPDKIFADEINAPFALFEPMAMADDVSAEDLDNVVEQPEIAVEDTADITIEEIPETIIAPATEPMPEIDNPEPTVDRSSVEEIEPVEDPEIPVEITPEPELVEISESEENTASENDMPQIQVAVETGLSDDEKSVNTIESEAVNANKPEESVPATPYIEEEEEEYVTYHNAPKSRFGLGFFLGFIFGLVIAALALAAYVLFISNGSLDFFK